MRYRRSSRVQLLRDRAAAALREARRRDLPPAERHAALVQGRGYAQIAQDQTYLEGEMLKQDFQRPNDTSAQEPQ